ncbi:MAG: transporter substrate-binding domain-containing protein [Propionibacteriaceae bacterium]|nr:transporter substrate-binding domain-containing protein [Propionibacteriaceae bacterium]
MLVGSSLSGAPAAFRTSEGSAPIGYEIDLVTALGRVLGVDTEIVPAAPGDLIPGLGSSFDIAISSVEITPDRQRQANLFTYITIGAMFGAPSAKKHELDPLDPEKLCGLRVGVLEKTRYHDDANAKATRCASDNQPALTVVPHTTGPGLIAALVREEIDLAHTDSTLTQYAVIHSRGRITPIGPVRDASPRGVAVAKNDPELSEAIRRALQHLMDSEDWRLIATGWGVEGSIITKAELNPLR